MENLDYIFPFHEDLAAIQKGDQWAIIDTGDGIIINFKSDLVSTVFKYATYPIFRDGLCLIEKEKDGIVYFGDINTLGDTVIEPKFLNASNFKDEKVIALKLKDAKEIMWGLKVKITMF
ncbi:WG repeat-containing protein [Psychroflexus torquis]|uniref:WG repeat-containing protein n=1 Tax=Psychroflexus torquis TaxID=57029 RepID=UPI0000D54DEF|nr:WG repeat-containing protein [Psychroflexus torquis]